ncbi:dihydroorotase/N-acyl-D-amino-acid deacylase [Granulicella pectinivorans]|uniref:Dihydroorotase/N-acyl-D-amino-acid deacylase n=1 Tax=Granulicella pectinivorans TaxID=474950 RepID=A0A1I6L5E6_9BACT|nr:amidohydrolase family protein [Granulicella pectinivorans]SFR98498.1 dihydroorotase/N-acyl-D-amino-acid deacylase [Granulicella pectinivorans]
MLLLRNALIVDGSGSLPYPGSVLLREGRIEAIGALEAPLGADIIDLDGAALSPGFIDMHSHSDLKVLENRREKSDQGITSEVVGNCGFSPYPCGHHKALLAEQQEGILNGGESWPNARAYLDAVKQSSRLVHVESLIGHGALRTAVCGKQANTTELIKLDELTATLDEALTEGAIGFSTGLMYAPGSQAPFAELEALCRVVARHGKLYTSHMRSYAWELLESIDEQIELARRTGCRLQISHLQTVGRDNWHKQKLALEKIEQAQAEGIDIGFDCYPYLAGSTVMTQLLPQTALADGLAGMLALIATSRADLEAFLDEETAQGWDDIFVSSLHTVANRPLIGKHIAAIAEARGTAPAATILDLLVEEGGRVNIVAFNQSEPNLHELLTHPLASIITDGFYVSERPHPRLAGAFPTFLGEFVRDRKWLSLQEAIRKITTAPAGRLGLTDRGNLTPGSIADLTIFSPERIGSGATFESPTLPPHGIHLVIKGQLLLPKSSSLLDGRGILRSGQALEHAIVSHPSTPDTIGELHYER